MRLLMLLIAHQLGDFVLQSDKMANRKKKSYRWLVVHSLIYAACVSIFAALWYPSWWILAGFAAIFLLHGIIDLIRIRLDGSGSRKRAADSGAEPDTKRQFYLFIADQFIHLAILFACSRLLPAQSESLAGISAWFGLKLSTRGLFMVFGFITATSPIAVFIKHLLNVVGKNPEICAVESSQANNAGKVIGILERLLIFPLCLISQYEAIGFVFAAKSVARFKEFEDRDFSERYITGTLASIGLTTMLALIYQLLPQ